MQDPVIDQIKNEKDYFSKAKLLKYVIYDKQLRIIDLSKELQMKPSYICHLLRLNKLDPMIVDGYYSDLISISHLFMISRLKIKEEMLKVYESVLLQSLTVLQTGELVRDIIYSVKTVGSVINKEEKKKIESILSDKNKNVKAHIIQTRVKAKIEIEVKGSVQETTEYIKSFISRIEPITETMVTVEEEKETDSE